MKRQPRGTPKGGEFAEDRRPQSADLTIEPIKTSDAFGHTQYTVNGHLHREDGPAVVNSDGGEAWYRNGKLHREGGPAVTWPEGDKEWWINGELVSAQSAPKSTQSVGTQQSLVDFNNSREPFKLGSPLLPIDSRTDQVQRGEIFDAVSVADEYIMNGQRHTSFTTFHRVRDGVFAGTPYAMRIQASRPIDDDEMLVMAGLVGYTYRSTIAGESIGRPERDSPYSFVVGADMTKSSRDDLGQAIRDFEDTLPTMIAEGSPIRKTDRAGKGTKGTRLVNGLGEDIGFELYYDDIWDPEENVNQALREANKGPLSIGEDRFRSTQYP